MNLYYRVAEHIFTIRTANPVMLAAGMENLKPFESKKSDNIVFTLVLDAFIEEQGIEVHSYNTDVLSYRLKKMIKDIVSYLVIDIIKKNV